jgi:hypothetical protein
MSIKLIRFKKQVVFKDCEGTVIKTYEIGDTEEYFGVMEKGQYYITSMGGIYFTEADVVEAKFEQTYCSQCGQAFGPGDHGFSHCSNHSHLKAVDD